MRNRILLIAFILFATTTSFSQSYTSYFTGSAIDKITFPKGGICMMGGATEHDEAMKWFLQRSDGGDILVLRASGSDGYNDYLYSELGIAVNSVESIVFNNASASNETYIQNKIQHAEAIWFAGGDQWNYVSYWRNTIIATLVNDAIKNRHIVVGGTSAGMAILGGFYFSAQNGSVTSAAALANPYNNSVTPDSTSFLKMNYMDSVITDTHYDNPDRRGRQVAFLAKMKTDWNVNVRGIACDEYTAVCIDTVGIAKVYGDYPLNDDNAYFIRSNCAIPANVPENCVSGDPLTWNQGTAALKVYNVKGTPTGTNTFDLNDWRTGVGGVWQNWWVLNGTLQTAVSTQISCAILPVKLLSFYAAKNNQDVLLGWQTATEINSSHFNIQRSKDGIQFEKVGTVAAAGNSNSLKLYNYSDRKLSAGIYYYRLEQVDIDGRHEYSKIIKINFERPAGCLVYPNPAATGNVFIESDQKQVQKLVVLNLRGQKMMEVDFFNDATRKSFNITKLPGGLYFLKLYSKENVLLENRKLVVE